jgi:hypothetical protein
MKLVLGFRPGVLHGDLRAEFDVRSDRLTELPLVGEVRRVERGHVELDEPFSLLLGDVKVPVDIDEMSEAELAGEPVRATEGFGGEGGEVINVFRLPGPEERLEQRIFEDAAVEGVLEAMQRFLPACEFVEGRHTSIVLKKDDGYACCVNSITLPSRSS